MSEMGYSPALKEAMAKIDRICMEYEVGAHILLVSPTHCEFRFTLPPWAALREELDDTGAGRIRLRVNKAEMGAVEAHRKAELTAHFLCECKDQAARLFQFAEMILQQLRDKWVIEHQFQEARPHRSNEN